MSDKFIQIQRIIITLFFCLLCKAISAQPVNSCESPHLHKGTQLYYLFQEPDESKYQDQSFFSKSFAEQKALSEQYLKDNTKWYADMRTIKIDDIIYMKDSSGNVLYDISAKEYKKPNDKKRTHILCNDGLFYYPKFPVDQAVLNDTVHFVNKKNGADILRAVPEEKPNGFAINFPVMYPNTMSRDAVLPDYLLSLTVRPGDSATFEFNYNFLEKNVLNKQDALPGIDAVNTLYKSAEQTYSSRALRKYLANGLVTEVWIKNRQFKEFKTVKVKDKSYDAYLIHEEIWSYSGKCNAVSTNDWTIAFSNTFSSDSKKLDADKWKKQHNTNAQGFIVEKIETWYIPYLGVYKMKKYNNYGMLNYILELAGVN
ncbi:MAG: hypothetical protein KJS45_01275 [Bacteroidetes bacterium]|nr:hypothetical protein [Bacteroidota bacterium]